MFAWIRQPCSNNCRQELWNFTIVRSRNFPHDAMGLVSRMRFCNVCGSWTYNQPETMGRGFINLKRFYPHLQESGYSSKALTLPFFVLFLLCCIVLFCHTYWCSAVTSGSPRVNHIKCQGLNLDGSMQGKSHPHCAVYFFPSFDSHCAIRYICTHTQFFKLLILEFIHYISLATKIPVSSMWEKGVERNALKKKH